MKLRFEDKMKEQSKKVAENLDEEFKCEQCDYVAMQKR